MVAIIIELNPVQQATYSYVNKISFSLYQLQNLAITNILPRTLTADTSGAFITLPEITWYTRGAIIWAQASTSHPVSFHLEVYSSPLLAAGLQIRVSTLAQNTVLQDIQFAPGTLQEKDFTLNIKIANLMHQQSTSNVPVPFTQQSTGTPTESRSTSHIQQSTREQHPNPAFVRHLERQRNQQREEYLKTSSLFWKDKHYKIQTNCIF